MKKAFHNILVLICVLLAATACVHNGGDIGGLFGRWHLERIEGDNMQPPAQHGDIFFSFQKDVVQLQRDNGMHEFSKTYGTYRIADDILYLDFPEENQAPFGETGLERQSSLKIIKSTNNKLELSYQLAGDKKLIYYLKKW